MTKRVRKKKTSVLADGSVVETEMTVDESSGIEEVMQPPPARKIVRNTDSEVSGEEGGDGAKRFKAGTPLAQRKAVGVEGVGDAASAVTDGVGVSASDGPSCSNAAAAKVVLSDSEVEALGSKRQSRPRRRSQQTVVGGGVGVSALKQVTDSLVEVALGGGVSSDVAKVIIAHAGKYETLLMELLAENERLRGRLDVYEASGVPSSRPPMRTAAPAMRPPVSSGAVATLPAVPVAIPKPIETWSVVVKGKKGTTSKEVVKKVVNEVGPSLGEMGVRIHGVKPTRDGGAVIRTPSVAERERIASNAKFQEVGLEVSVNDRLGPKVVVHRVHSQISPDEFMTEMYEMNLKAVMSPEMYRKSVRLVSTPWKCDPDKTVNVTLECTNRVMEKFVEEGVYIRWFRFIARVLDAVPSCHRCFGFDHWVRNCRMTEDICRRCGLAGHLASRCSNPSHCRNCEFKGLPADHMMISPVCPLYAAMMARANARH